MKLVSSHELSGRVNGLLNAPTVEELVTEAEALVYEIERRMVKAVADHDALAAARDKAMTVVNTCRRRGMR